MIVIAGFVTGSVFIENDSTRSGLLFQNGDEKFDGYLAADGVTRFCAVPIEAGEILSCDELCGFVEQRVYVCSYIVFERGVPEVPAVVCEVGGCQKQGGVIYVRSQTFSKAFDVVVRNAATDQGEEQELAGGLLEKGKLHFNGVFFCVNVGKSDKTFLLPQRSSGLMIDWHVSQGCAICGKIFTGQRDTPKWPAASPVPGAEDYDALVFAFFDEPVNTCSATTRENVAGMWHDRCDKESLGFGLLGLAEELIDLVGQCIAIAGIEARCKWRTSPGGGPYPGGSFCLLSVWYTPCATAQNGDNESNGQCDSSHDHLRFSGATEACHEHEA